jgi:hypothetical protein
MLDAYMRKQLPIRPRQVPELRKLLEIATCRISGKAFPEEPSNFFVKLRIDLML